MSVAPVHGKWGGLASRWVFFRDWRIRTLVPVLLIHVLAFSGLFTFIHRTATRGVVSDYQQVASVLLDEVEGFFEESMEAHGTEEIARVFSRHRRSPNVSFALADADGTLVVPPGGGSFRENPLRPLMEQSFSARTAWDPRARETGVVTGVRRLANLASCRSCHGSSQETLGFLIMSQDVSAPLRAARARVRTGFAAIVGAWVVLLAAMAWLKALVITRPLEQIQQTLKTAVVDGTAPPHDLETMAAELQGAIQALLRQEEEQRQTLAASMARAEQLACLGEIAAGLTHEIKNPLAAVMAALETLLTDTQPPSPPPRELLAQMLRELRRTHETLDRLLTLARPATPRRVPVDVAKLMGEVATLFHPRASRRGIAFEVRCPQPLPTIQGDPNLLSQVLVNLLTNAFQATPPKGSISLSAAPFPQGDGVALMVSDTGSGIRAEDLPRVFEPFFTTKEGGTGLGLPIVRQIVTQHGGSVRIHSEPGKGTRVVVLLPVRPPLASSEVVVGPGPDR